MDKTIMCEKCRSEMLKKGIMNSGNSKYNVFRCKNCGNEKLVAVGVN
jgi:transcription elongation factor Elf1